MKKDKYDNEQSKLYQYYRNYYKEHIENQKNQKKQKSLINNSDNKESFNYSNPNQDDYGNYYDNKDYDKKDYQNKDYNKYDYRNFENKDYCNIPEDLGNVEPQDDINQGNFAQELYESYLREHPQKEYYIFNIIIFILGFVILWGQIKIQYYEYQYNTYYKLIDSYNEAVQYEYMDIERTEKTIYPVLIENNKEIQNYNKYCLPCGKLHQELDDIFNNKIIKRKIENIKNIPLSETDLYIKLSEKTNDLIDNYKKPNYVSAFDILKKPSITDNEQCIRILRSWLWASLYYSSQNKNKEALLLAYAPILVCQDIEANSADGATINFDMMEVQIEACKQLLYLINNTNVDSNLCKKIAINFIKVVNTEPSFIRKVENYMRCHNNFFSFLEKKNNLFAKYINNSNICKDLYQKLYEGAKEQVKEIEKTGNYSSFYYWQADILKLFEITKPKKNDPDVNIDNIELIMCQKAFSNSFLNFFNYYCLNLEKIAIMKGTAVALAYKSYEIENSYFGISEYKLNKWLSVNIPKDPLTRQSYKLFSTSNYKLMASSINNDHYKGKFIKGDKLLLIK